MDIIPSDTPSAPKYPKTGSKRKKQRQIVERLGGVIPSPELMFSDEECSIIQEIISLGWDSLSWQLLGGAPVMDGSEQAIRQKKRYNMYRKVYNKFKRFLKDEQVLPKQKRSKK